MNALIDAIQNDPNFQKPKACYVSVYLNQRCYGGPEEGGWWYDCNELQGSIRFLDRDAAEAYLESKKAEIAQQNEEQKEVHARAFASLPDEDEGACPAGYSEGYIPTGWSDGGDYRIIIEDEQGSIDNTDQPRPRYE